MKIYINEMKVKNKTVILRTDYNVPIRNGRINDTKKIDDTFETIDYLLSNNNKIIILTHMGRIKSEEDKQKNTLYPVYEYLNSLNKYKVKFSKEPMGEEFENEISKLEFGEILLAENTRYLDLNNKLESKCDIQLAMYYSKFASFFVNDAFACMHRDNTTITGIPRYLPSAFGLLVKKELENLKVVTTDIQKPFIVVMGGAKLDDKIELVSNLLEKADYVLFGGGIANSFLKAAGYDIGASLTTDESVITAYKLLEKYQNKIILPKDVIVSPSYSENSYNIKKIDDIVLDDVIGDIGSGAIQNYARILSTAKTIFLNGTVGIYEQLEFSNGTRMLLEEITKTNAIKIVGGGDAAASVKKFNLEDKMDFISTGGGATLTYIANNSLIGIDAVIESIKKRPWKNVFVNLKDWLNLEENKEYILKVKDLEAIYFPANPYLYLYNGLEIGLQNISTNEKGAYTGLVSVEHLKDFNIKWALLNHRELENENIKDLQQKIKILVDNDISIIFCMDNINLQIHDFFKELFEKVNYDNIHIAYEPKSEANLSLDKIKKSFEELKLFLKNNYPTYKTIYGGDITVENIKNINQELDADGYLVSKEALDSNNLEKIIDLLNY